MYITITSWNAFKNNKLSTSSSTTHDIVFHCPSSADEHSLLNIKYNNLNKYLIILLQ